MSVFTITQNACNENRNKFHLYRKKSTVLYSKILDKTVNIVYCRTDSCRFGRVMAGMDKASIIFKWIEFKRFLAEVFYIVRDVCAYISSKYNVSVKTHAKVIDCNCQMIHIVIKYIAQSLVEFYLVEKFFQVAVRKIR